MFENLLEWDRELFLWLNGLGTSFFDSFWLLLTHKATNVWVYLVVAAYYYKKRGVKPLLLLLLTVAVLILITDQTTNLFKNGVGRLRPCHDVEIGALVRLVKASCGGQYGFFSGHASNSFALATFFSLVWRPYSRKLAYFFFTLAALIAYSRVYVGVHYPLDILAGGVAGSLFGIIAFKIFKTLRWVRLK